MGFGVVLDLCFEVPIVALKVWSYPGAPFALPVGEGGYRLPVAELIAGGSVFGLVAALRIFKDDQGRTIVERGLSHLKPAKAKVVTLLALYAVMQMIVWGPGTMPDFLYQPYMVEWPKNYPTHLLNGACDAPGYRGTPYGPCPGSDGFQMPGRRVKLDR
jgi:hypothetical protein